MADDKVRMYSPVVPEVALIGGLGGNGSLTMTNGRGENYVLDNEGMPFRPTGKVGFGLEIRPLSDPTVIPADNPNTPDDESKIITPGNKGPLEIDIMGTVQGNVGNYFMQPGDIPASDPSLTEGTTVDDVSMLHMTQMGWGAYVKGTWAVPLGNGELPLGASFGFEWNTERFSNDAGAIYASSSGNMYDFNEHGEWASHRIINWMPAVHAGPLSFGLVAGGWHGTDDMQRNLTDDDRAYDMPAAFDEGASGRMDSIPVVIDQTKPTVLMLQVDVVEAGRFFADLAK